MKKPLTFGISNNLSWLAIIAKEKDFFRENGLEELDFRRAHTGRQMMQFLQKGWTDIANVIDANVAFLAFEHKPKVKLLACTQINYDACILARRDAHILNPADLKGKKLGYMPRTSSHMFMTYFLRHHGLELKEVKPVPLSIEQMEKALLRGEVDAVSLWQPFRTETLLAAARENIDLTTLKNEGFFKYYILLAATSKCIEKNREKVDAVIKALEQAEAFTKNNKAAAQAIIASENNLPLQIFQQITPDLNFMLTPIAEEFWDQVKTHIDWIDPDNKINYENFIDRLTNIS